VIAESFERIHRSNLVGMGVLPLQFLPGDSVASVGLTGREVYAVRGLERGVGPGRRAEVEATREDGSRVAFPVQVRIDSDAEAAIYRAGGILRLVAERMADHRTA
jgi:aconitate hydratase